MEIAVGLVFGSGFERDATDVARISSLSADKSAAVQVYLQLIRDRGVLAGSSFALLVLFAGSISEIRNLPNLKTSIIALALGAILLAVAVFHVAGRKAHEAHRLAEQIATTLPVAPAPTTQSGKSPP